MVTLLWSISSCALFTCICVCEIMYVCVSLLCVVVRMDIFQLHSAFLTDGDELTAKEVFSVAMESDMVKPK